MALADELLEQADRLLAGPPATLTQADIRRAVSNCYYGLFHLLVEDAAALVCPPRPASLLAVVRRGFQHVAMRDVCKSLVSGRTAGLSASLRPVFSDPIEPELAAVAKAFVDLQAERHAADYALNEAMPLFRAEDAVKIARLAFADWQAVRGADNGNAFLVALLLAKQWRAD